MVATEGVTGSGAAGDELRRRVGERVRALAPRLTEVARFLKEHPEVGHQEYEAQRLLCSVLEEAGFAVERGVGGLPTSFRAEHPSGGGRRPRIAFLAEYDALPEIGHGCGHNLIAAISLGAALALREEGRGTVVVLGTPAEETTGGKIAMCEAGVFDGLDAAMLVHPGWQTSVGGSSLASHPVEIEFFGRAAHAAAAPEKGINALDAMLLTFQAVHAVRPRLDPAVRLPGIILDGGTAPNVVPDHTRARFSLRAADARYLEEVVVPAVLDCARGAAQATGCRLEWRFYEPLFQDMRGNPVLARLFADEMRHLGHRVEELPPTERGGSTDVGNVSHRVPAVQPSVAIGDPPPPGHTREFAEATLSEPALRAMLDACTALAVTGARLLHDAGLVEEAWQAWRQRMQEAGAGAP
ncbi:MAG: M20 family metallopeptidase [Bacillota bacterium]